MAPHAYLHLCARTHSVRHPSHPFRNSRQHIQGFRVVGAGPASVVGWGGWAIGWSNESCCHCGFSACPKALWGGKGVDANATNRLLCSLMGFAMRRAESGLGSGVWWVGGGGRRFEQWAPSPARLGSLDRIHRVGDYFRFVRMHRKTTEMHRLFDICPPRPHSQKTNSFPEGVRPLGDSLCQFLPHLPSNFRRNGKRAILGRTGW